MAIMVNRMVLAHRLFSEISQRHLAWAFVSGTKKQNTMKATPIADHHGPTL